MLLNSSRISQEATSVQSQRCSTCREGADLRGAEHRDGAGGAGLSPAAGVRGQPARSRRGPVTEIGLRGHGWGGKHTVSKENAMKA